MKIICSWCRREGKVGFIGEKAPLHDLRETHSICKVHQLKVQAQLRNGIHVLERRGGRRAASPTVKKRVRRKKAM